MDAKTLFGDVWENEVVDVRTILTNEKYIPYYDAQQRLQIFFGGSSSGKSFFVLGQRTIKDILEGERNFLIVRKTQRALRKSVWKELIKGIRARGMWDMFHINKTEMEITHKVTRKQIVLVGMDDPEKIKSISPEDGVFTDIICEEATEMSYDGYKQLRKRLRGRSNVKKRITLLFNPIDITHWIYEEIFQAVWEEGMQEYKTDELLISHSTYKDNAYLEEDDIFELENEKDSYYRDVYTYGKFGVLGNVVFKRGENWRVADISEMDELFEDGWEYGGDWGYSPDPAAGGKMFIDDKRKKIYIRDTFYLLEGTNQELFELIKERWAKDVGGHIGDLDIVFDSAEKKSFREMKEKGLHGIRRAKKGQGSIAHGIMKLKEYEIIVHVECQEAINELTKYKHKEDAFGRPIRGKYVDRDNHFIDLLRYVMETHGKAKYTGWDK